MTETPETRYTRSADGTNLALPVEGPPVKSRRRKGSAKRLLSFLVAGRDGPEPVSRWSALLDERP
jgi:hypothetical protein